MPLTSATRMTPKARATFLKLRQQVEVDAKILAKNPDVRDDLFYRKAMERKAKYEKALALYNACYPPGNETFFERRARIKKMFDDGKK